MFIFLAISQFETVQRSQIMTYIVLIVCVIVMMFLFSLFMPTYVAIILSSVLAATLGVVMTK